MLKDISDTVISLMVHEGAHHYDLRGKHENDTQSVKTVRQKEAQQIKTWIKQYRNKNKPRTVHFR